MEDTIEHLYWLAEGREVEGDDLINVLNLR